MSSKATALPALFEAGGLPIELVQPHPPEAGAGLHRTIQKSLAPAPSGGPTEQTYDALLRAYSFFNTELFESSLPPCLITMQRKGGCYGYFAGSRFRSHDRLHIADEIALNPTHFEERSIAQTLSTLVHEMVHLQQHHWGRPGRGRYHNREWARMMKRIGLVPSATGQPGGQETGDRVGHYIEPDGPFDRTCRRLLAEGFVVPYGEIAQRVFAKAPVSLTGKAASKGKYTCPCCDSNVWGKPGLYIICGNCNARLVAEASFNTTGW
jgi:hypothetical protein